MTNEQARRIRVAIAECDRYIDIESPRSADLRPAAVAKHLEFCHAHKAKLQRVLETGDLSILHI